MIMICKLDEKEYKQFQEKHPNSNFLNGVECGHLEKMEGYPTSYVGYKENNQLKAVTLLVKMPVMKKFYFFYAPRGFLIDYQDKILLKQFTKELKKFCRKEKGIFVILDPYILYKERDQDGDLVENGFNQEYVVENLIQLGYKHKGFSIGYGKNMQFIRWMYAMDLTEHNDKDTLWKELHQQTRWSINRTLKFHMQVRELTRDELPLFDNIMKKTGERRHFHSRDLAFYEHQWDAYKEHLKILLAYIDCDLYRQSIKNELVKEQANLHKIEEQLESHSSKKIENRKKVSLEAIETFEKKIQEVNELESQYGKIIPMAASMFMLYYDEVTYLTSGVYEEFKNYYAPYAIQWTMIQEAIKLGYKRYNFYGISGEFDRDNENYGVYKFKRGFPGQVEELVGDFLLPVNPFIYFIYHLLRERD